MMTIEDNYSESYADDYDNKDFNNDEDEVFWLSGSFCGAAILQRLSHHSCACDGVPLYNDDDVKDDNDNKDDWGRRSAPTGSFTLTLGTRVPPKMDELLEKLRTTPALV